jgi:predicted ATPase
MITRIEVDGFKSLRDFALDLEPYTVLVGPNSAGKSNVLEALALVSRLAVEPVTEAMKQGRGRIVDQFTRHGGKSATSIRIAIEVLVHGTVPLPAPGADTVQSRFRYKISIERQMRDSGVERLVVRDERLTSMRREHDPWLDAHPKFVAMAGYQTAGTDEFFTLKDSERRVIEMPSHWPEERQPSPAHAFLFSAATGHAHEVRNDLSGYRLLQLDASRLRAPSERVDSDDLAVDASNLPTILAGLPAARLGEIRADLVALVPGIASFDVVSEDDSFRIDFELSDGERLPARLVSDGTLRILALLTALRVEPRPSLIAIEEPENGIYPGKLRALLTLLREVSERRYDDEDSIAGILASVAKYGNARVSSAHLLPTQVLLTTHSPVVLAALRAHPEHLRFVDTVRRNGERVTRVRGVGDAANSAQARTMISPREIDTLLHAADAEDAE